MKKKLNCVMLVDDDEATNFLHSMIVKRSGIAQQVETVESANVALHYLERCKDQNKHSKSVCPDLIFLDINMPVMNGWEFLDEYDKLAEEKQQKPVMVMLTASPNPDDEAKAKSISSVTEYRRKPLSAKMLDELMREYFTEYLE